MSSWNVIEQLISHCPAQGDQMISGGVSPVKRSMASSGRRELVRSLIGQPVMIDPRPASSWQLNR